MPRELIIKGIDLKATLNVIDEILRTKGNNEGGCGFIIGESGVLHLILQNADSARYVLESNKLPIAEERDVLLIMAHSGVDSSWDWEHHISPRFDKAEALAKGLYILTVPEGGQVEISTHIEAQDNPPDATGCSGIIFNILHSLRLTK
jgi:hypothetical protein